jgi:hypothetical protein
MAVSLMVVLAASSAIVSPVLLLVLLPWAARSCWRCGGPIEDERLADAALAHSDDLCGRKRRATGSAAIQPGAQRGGDV